MPSFHDKYCIVQNVYTHSFHPRDNHIVNGWRSCDQVYNKKTLLGEGVFHCLKKWLFHKISRWAGHSRATQIRKTMSLQLNVFEPSFIFVHLHNFFHPLLQVGGADTFSGSYNLRCYVGGCCPYCHTVS